MVEKTVDWLDSSGFRFPITSSPHFCIILAYGLLYVSSTLIVQLTILFCTSCGSLHGHDRLDCAALGQVIAGPGVAGRRGIPLKGRRNSVSGSSHAARTRFWSLKRHQGKGFTICKTLWQVSE